MNESNQKITPEVAAHRTANYEIEAQFLNRWSPRSFQKKEVPDELLYRVLEAARWAPSGSNIQPWRFIIARTHQDRSKFNEFINEGNREWCEKAPVLALIISHKLTPNDNPNRSHAFDAGASWGYMALQASNEGLITHAMGGFDRDKAQQILNIPDEYDLHAVIAIGYRGEIEALSESHQEREKPSIRRHIRETVFEGIYGQELDVK